MKQNDYVKENGIGEKVEETSDLILYRLTNNDSLAILNMYEYLLQEQEALKPNRLP